MKIYRVYFGEKTINVYEIRNKYITRIWSNVPELAPIGKIFTENELMGVHKWNQIPNYRAFEDSAENIDQFLEKYLVEFL